MTKHRAPARPTAKVSSSYDGRADFVGLAIYSDCEGSQSRSHVGLLRRGDRPLVLRVVGDETEVKLGDVIGWVRSASIEVVPEKLGDDEVPYQWPWP